MGIVACLWAACLPAQAQDTPEYEPITVTLVVPRTGSAELAAVVAGNTVYLSVAELFNLLKIQNQRSAEADSISGFFIDPANTYLIDGRQKMIRLGNTKHTLKPGELVVQDFDLYLHIDVIGRVFDLPCSFDARALVVTLRANTELPVVRIIKQELFRNSIAKSQPTTRPDSVLAAAKTFFLPGPVEWTINAQKITGSTQFNGQVRASALVLGGVLLGIMRWSPPGRASSDFRWHKALPQGRWVRQIHAGRTPLGSSLPATGVITGIQLTNITATPRRAFGTYRINDQTEPGWIVELYINKVLVNFIRTDATGAYTFDVPLVYGTTSITLKFYGPWGEVTVKEQNIHVPYNLLPKGKAEHTAVAGMSGRDYRYPFAKWETNFGLTTKLTVGGGVEWNPRLGQNKPLHYLQMTLQPFPRALVYAQNIAALRTNVRLAYALPGKVQAELSYTRFGTQKRVLGNNFLQEHRVSVNMPLIKKQGTNWQMNLMRQQLPKSWLYNFNATLSSRVGVTGNTITFRRQWIPISRSLNTLDVQSNIPVSRQWQLNGQLRYNIGEKQLMQVNLQSEKKLGVRGSIRMLAGYQPEENTLFGTLSLSMNLEVLQAGFSAGYSNQQFNWQANASGSLLMSRSGQIQASSVSVAEKARVILSAFLDLNNNKVQDKWEPKVAHVQVAVSGGGNIQPNKKDTSLVITDLDAFKTQLLAIDDTQFENLSWRLSLRSIQLTLNPGETRYIKIPVTVGGEANGTIQIQNEQRIRPLGKINVIFTDQNGTRVASALSDQDGYYSYLGLKPGTYTVAPDPFQLKKMQLTCTPAQHIIAVKPTIDGDYIPDLDFKVSKIPR